MIAKQRTARFINTLVLAGAAFLALTITANAQVQTTTHVHEGQATHEVTIERGEIAWVSGNNVVVRMEDGSLRFFENVPESTTVNVEGKNLNVHQLQPGMKVERQTITTTTPKVITTVKTVSGTVWHVFPPKSIILTMENGENHRFNIPKGTTFMVDGRKTDAWGLKKGMKVQATEIIEEPETHVTQEVRRTGIAPPPPPEPEPNMPIVVYVPTPATTEVAEESEPAALPQTGSYFPLFGLLGIVSLGLGLGLKAFRLRASH